MFIDVCDCERRSQDARLNRVSHSVEQPAVVLDREPCELCREAALMLEEVHRVLRTRRLEVV